MRFKDAIARSALRIMSSLRSTSCLTASCFGLKLIVFWRGSTNESNTEAKSKLEKRDAIQQKLNTSTEAK